MQEGIVAPLDRTRDLGLAQPGTGLSGIRVPGTGKLGGGLARKQASQPTGQARDLWSTAAFAPWIREAAKGLGEGWRAAKDYERLRGMSAERLAAEGIVRADIPRALFERHFQEGARIP